MVKILIVLYDGGKAASEQPKLLGTTENKLGFYDWLIGQGHEVVVTSDKEGPNSVFQKNLPDTEILITTPFHPAYLSADLIAKAKKLKLCVTAGVGSDHIDLNAANERKIGVMEVSGSNVVSVAEHVIMTMLLLVRNYNTGHAQSVNHEWNVAEIARNAYDLEGKVVGTIGCGRIGYRVLQRLEPFNCKELLWFDYADLPADAKSKINARRVDTLDELFKQCDIITVNCPLHEQTKGLINAEAIKKMKKGVWIINTARGAICDRMAIVDGLKSGHINAYGGDVWDVQPAPPDHPWREMTNPLGGGNGMVPHYSGTTLDAQARYASGTKTILENYFAGKPQDPGNVIVEDGHYASKAYGQRK